jgi:hypothetical protein
VVGFLSHHMDGCVCVNLSIRLGLWGGWGLSFILKDTLRFLFLSIGRRPEDRGLDAVRTHESDVWEPWIPCVGFRLGHVYLGRIGSDLLMDFNGGRTICQVR